MGIPHCVLFVDEVKAFDREVRELVLGFPADMDDPIKYLRSIGIDKKAAVFMVQ